MAQVLRVKTAPHDEKNVFEGLEKLDSWLSDERKKYLHRKELEDKQRKFEEEKKRVADEGDEIFVI